MGGSVYGRFADQNDIVLSGQIQCSNNNNVALNAALAEADHFRASNAGLQPDALNISLANNVPTVTNALQGTVGAALGDIGQQGTPSQEPGGGGGGIIPCPEIHQYVMIRSDINTPIPVQVKYVEKGMYLWCPLTGTFEKLIRADVREDQPLWGVGGNKPWAVGSERHPLIQRLDDTTGLALSRCGVLSKCVMAVKGQLKEIELRVLNLNQTGTVKHLETNGPTHIYAHGSTMETMLLFHNLKPEPEFGG